MQKEPVVYVDRSGRPIQEGPPREGDSLDVGFGGDIDFLTERLMAAKQVMDISDQRYPFEKTGIKKSGTLRNLDEEVKRNNTKSIKSIKEEFDPAPTPPKKQLPTSIVKQKPVIKEDNENYIYYAKNGVKDDDEERYDLKKAPSLTQELMMATKSQGQSKSIPDFSRPINEQLIKKSKLPEAIKQSFLKNPLTPPSATAALGGANLDAITEKFKKMQQLKQPVKQDQPVRSVVNEVKDTSNMSKREKIKEQLRPIVKELIMEILAEKLLK